MSPLPVTPQNAATMANMHLRSAEQIVRAARDRQMAPDAATLEHIMGQFTVARSVAISAGKEADIGYDNLEPGTLKVLGLEDTAARARAERQAASQESDRLTRIREGRGPVPTR